MDELTSKSESKQAKNPKFPPPISLTWATTVGYDLDLGCVFYREHAQLHEFQLILDAIELNSKDQLSHSNLYSSCDSHVCAQTFRQIGLLCSVWYVKRELIHVINVGTSDPAFSRTRITNVGGIIWWTLPLKPTYLVNLLHSANSDSVERHRCVVQCVCLAWCIHDK